MAQYVPKQGDIVWLDFQPQAGHEQDGRRPALVLSPDEYNHKVGLMLCCPITKQIKGYPFEVQLKGTVRTKGAVLADQIKSLDWRARRAEYKERANVSVLREALSKAQALLTYSEP
ncbi:MAG: endoribonuclease MazF [Nitrospiraceae bacterium]